MKKKKVKRIILIECERCGAHAEETEELKKLLHIETKCVQYVVRMEHCLGK